jgi:hypothetical protein
MDAMLCIIDLIGFQIRTEDAQEFTFCPRTCSFKRYKLVSVQQLVLVGLAKLGIFLSNAGLQTKDLS